MHKADTDILQIKKYLNGELDAKAMHRLERRAQDDPFLMDALEGYQLAKKDQQANLDDLAGRLSGLVAQKKGRIISFGVIGIAASVLIICSVGGWWIMQSSKPAELSKYKPAANLVKPVTKPAVAPVDEQANATKPVAGQAGKPVGATVAAQADEKRLIANGAEKSVRQKKPAPQIVADEAAQVPPALANSPIDTSLFARKSVLREVKIAKRAADKNATVYKDTTPVNEMIVMGYTSKNKKDTASPSPRKFKKVKQYDTSKMQLLVAKAPGLMAQPNNAPAASNDLLMKGNLSAELTQQLLSNQVIRGRVMGKDDGLPIQGASVKVSGTNKATQTDAEGRFSIKADSNRANLVIANIGYQTQHVSANNRDSVKNISLEPSASSLNEVVVTGYSPQANRDSLTVNAHPQKGWSSFKKYLKQNAVSPDGKTGIVKVTFTVDKNGRITNITVLKGLSEAADKKAVDIVNNGPGWLGNSNKQPEKVTLRIKFVK